MLELLHDWQELVSGALAFFAGAFIFFEGRLERSSRAGERAEDAFRERSKTRQILERLDQASSDLSDQVERYTEVVDDVLVSLDNGDAGVQLPLKIVIPKVFEIIFAQLTTQEVPVDVYLRLSTLLERGTEFDEDFRRFLIVFSHTVTEYRTTQPKLPLIGDVGRRASDDPSAQTLQISSKALQEAVSDLRSILKQTLNEGESNERHICAGERSLVSLQSIEARAKSRQDRS